MQVIPTIFEIPKMNGGGSFTQHHNFWSAHYPRQRDPSSNNMLGSKQRPYP